jgi:antitoxin component of RelBE/YafQ-DinJ toxin-antitoxin module
MKDKMIPVRVSANVKKEFTDLCENNETTPSEHLRELITRELKKARKNSGKIETAS